MDGNVKDNLLEAVRIMMKPLVRLLIKQGVTHADFTEAMKEVYVDSAIRHFGGDRRVNRSAVAIKTGLTRKEVKNVIDRALTTADEKKVHSRPERVLTGWHNDPAYIGPYGVPLELPYESHNDAPSFVNLVRAYSGDMSPKAMLQELVRAGSVIEHDGHYKAVRRDFEPGALSRELIIRLGEVGYKVFLTAAANIEKKEQGGGYFDRFVYAENACNDEVIEKFDKHIKERGQQFLEHLDNWMNMNAKEAAAGEDVKEMGVYVVHFVEPSGDKSSLSALLGDIGVSASDAQED